MLMCNMKKWLKMILIAFVITIILVAAYAFLTIWQLQNLRKELEDTSLQQDAEALGKGDCAKLPVVEEKAAALQRKLNRACFNPLIKSMIKKYSENRDICHEVNDPNSEMLKMLSHAQAFCNPR